MSKLDIDKELGDLIFRFKRLKKAIEQENTLSPAQRAAAAAAEAFVKQTAALRKSAPTQDELRAQELAKTLQARGVLGTRPPPRQPTDQELFGHLVPSEDQLNKAEQEWGATNMNNWFAEAMKPINSRFKSPEEEQAYWDSIKVAGKDDGGSGY